jgi:TolB-like protein/DNA-binding winged helix-turn-helix (wHTH) protein/Flp pilus assembly protein TadD
MYEFADFRLDTQRRVLTSRIDGLPIQVTGKVFDTLVYFVEHAGVLLDKQALLAALWPNVVVEESNLTQTIHTLRRVLGERAGEHRFIVTVPGRGYRFVAEVRRPTSEEPAPPIAAERTVAGQSASPRVRWWAVAALISVVLLALTSFYLTRTPARSQRTASNVAHTPIIAVLPFVDMSEAHDQSYFGDGLSEEILNLLAQSSAMRVIARTSSFSFKDQPNLDIAAIARKLEATHVLEGSVRKSGEHVRITAQLVDGATSAHLWSRTYDREVQDIFTVQDDIAAAVSSALNATLSNQNQPQQADTTNPDAFERYLHGKYFFNRGGESDVMRAKQYFEAALHADPNYARAWVGLAGIYTALAWSQGPSETTQREWLQSIERGLSLGPGLAEAHVRAAQYYWSLGDWGRSEEHCKVAIALNPSDALVLTVSALKAIAIGHRLEALSLQQRAVTVDPLSAEGHAYLGLYLAAVEKFEEAEKELRDARELSPTLSGIDFDLARVLVTRKRFDEALAMFEQIPEGEFREQGLALVHYGKGNVKPADEAMSRLTTLAAQPDATAHTKIYLAEVQAFRGDAEKALKSLEGTVGAAAERHMTASMIDAVQLIHRSPFFIPLHTHARWHALFPDQESFGEPVAKN